MPFVEKLCHDMEYEDSLLVHRLLHGFPLVGVLDPCVVGVSKELPKNADMTLNELSALGTEFRDSVIGALKQSVYSADLSASADEDAAEGYMSNRILLKDVPETAHVSRRLAVRQDKVKKGVLVGSTRAVDHCT